MQTNYLTIGVVVVLALAVLILLIIRNRKDEKAFKKDKLKNSEFVERQDPDKD